MKVLFVSSGNNQNGISPIIEAQGNSLLGLGVNIVSFTIKGKGLKGYIKNIFLLKEFIKKENIDIVHAHYTLSGIIAGLSTKKPVIVSLMGSDIFGFYYQRKAAQFFSKFIWEKTIVKSMYMKQKSGIKNALVLPNGIDLNLFKPIEKKIACKYAGWDTMKKNILFLANNENKVKNFPLAKKAFNLIKNTNNELKIIHDVPHSQIVYYLNAADVLLLTSFWEGSPNVIKEAMACNCPIVSTDVGDVKENIKEIENCFICEFDPKDIADKISIILKNDRRTDARQKLLDLGLDSISVASKLIKIYEKVLKI